MSHDPEPANTGPTLLERIFASEIRAWHGRAPLWSVFWLKGVLTSGVLLVLYATTVILHQPLAEQGLLIFCGLYTVWILVSIWRCSLASDTFWALLARYLTIAWAANAGLVLFFRQLELLAILGGLSGPGF
ncbi:MAG: hypothetical protein M5U35_06290 [Roseovarius sp.]|nr:hypothetical protein [Roseovarius sp.]